MCRFNEFCSRYTFLGGGFLKTGLLCVALAVLKLALWTRLALNSPRSICLCLVSAGIKGRPHHHLSSLHLFLFDYQTLLAWRIPHATGCPFIPPCFSSLGWWLTRVLTQCQEEGRKFLPLCTTLRLLYSISYFPCTPSKN